MFFHQLSVDSVSQITQPQTVSMGPDSFALLLSTAQNPAFSLCGSAQDSPAFSLFLLVPDEAECVIRQASSFLLISFSVPDEVMRAQIRLLPRRLPFPEFTVRHFAINFLSAYSLHTPMYHEKMAYDLLTILFYGHLAQHRAFPTDAALSFDRSLDTTLPESDTALAVRYISDHLAEDLTADAVGSSIRMSGKQANEMFKREYGCTVAQFINRFRLFRAKELLCYTNSSITEIATMTGFKTVHYFSRYFKEKENLSPIEYKRTVTETISLHTLSG